MTMMKMNNKVKSIVGMVIILIGIMMSIGTVVYATNEEEAKQELIAALVEEGFIYDEYSETWMYVEYEFYGEGEYEYIHAWYDVDTNIGIAFVVDYNKFGIVDECCSGAFQWNYSTHEIEELGSFEWDM